MHRLNGAFTMLSEQIMESGNSAADSNAHRFKPRHIDPEGAPKHHDAPYHLFQSQMVAKVTCTRVHIPLQLRYGARVMRPRHATRRRTGYRPVNDNSIPFASSLMSPC